MVKNAFFVLIIQLIIPISGRVNGASATKTVDRGSIPGWVKPKAIKIGNSQLPS